VQGIIPTLRTAPRIALHTREHAEVSLKQYAETHAQQ
jgi:hypothetical protein